MPYNNNIPLANNQISISQGDILGNFQALGTRLNNVDNLACLFPALAPTPATLPGIIGLYNKNNQLTYRPQNTPANGTEISFTVQTNAGISLYNYNGWTQLPSGIFLCWNSLAPVYAGGVRNQSLIWTNGVPPLTTVLQVSSNVITNQPIPNVPPFINAIDPNVAVMPINMILAGGPPITSTTLYWYENARSQAGGTIPAPSNYGMSIFIIGI